MLSQLSLVELLVLALAAYRITVLFYEDKIMGWFRKLMGEVDVEGFVTYPDTFFGNLISCMRCVSVYAAISVVVMYLILPILVLPFALSGAAMLLYEK